MQKSGIGETPDVDHAILCEFKIQDDVKMYSQLQEYDDFWRFDFPQETDLSAISKRVYEGFPTPPWSPIKHHLFIAHIPKEIV